MQVEIGDDIRILIEKVKKAAEDLERDGYAVIEEVFTKEECALLKERMWKHWEIMSDGKITKEKDFSKIRASELPSHKHGIIESWRINHLDVIREIRRDKRLLWIYALLYGSDQLTASMDRISFKFPGKKYKSKGEWPHADQHPGRLGRITIQSYLTMIDCEEDSPGNRFYQNSHNEFASFFAEKSENFASGDWNLLTEEEKKELPKKCPLVKPTYKAGSLVMWDSRTVHNPDDGTNFEDGRFVVYVCYNLLWDAKEKFKKSKSQAFLNCNASSHSPVPMKLFPKMPRTYGKEKGPYAEIPIEKLGLSLDEGVNPQGIEKYLFCFEEYENREGLLLGDPKWKESVNINKPLLEFVSPFTPIVKRKNTSPVKEKIESIKKSKK